MDKLKNIFGGGSPGSEHLVDTPDTPSATPSATTPAAPPPSDPDAERGFLADALDASTLSYTTRVKGFAACFGLGLLISLLAVGIFSITLNLFAFGVLYTMGNCLAVASTLFLMGPMKQLKTMFSDTRWIASTVMLVCLLLTLVSAFVLGKKALTILFCVIQFGAMTWYALSYIPYARDGVKKFVDGIIS